MTDSTLYIQRHVLQAQSASCTRLFSAGRSLCHRVRRITSHTLAGALCFAMVMTGASVTSAQDMPDMDLTLTVGEFMEAPSFVQAVPSQNLGYMEVSDGAGKLVFAQNESLPQILLLPLSAKGDVIEKQKAKGFSLPGNTDKKIVNKVLALATHPTLPVLYVWQDRGTQRDNVVMPKNEAQLKYSHLLIYDISKAEPVLLMSTCSGIDFMYGRDSAMLNTGNNGKRLFVPNMRYKVTRGFGVALGYYELNAKGLPILTGADPEADPAAVSGAADEDAPADDNTEPDIAEQATDKVTSGRGGGLTMLHMSNLGSRYQAGTAHYIDDAHTLMRSGSYLATYDTSNRSGRIVAVILPYTNTRTTSVVVNDSRSMFYSNYPFSNRIVVWAIFQGYPSLMPQHVLVNSYVTYGKMVVMAKHQKLVLGCAGRVILLSLDKQGWVLPKIEQFKADATRVQNTVYSHKFDRLYVGTDAPLEVEP